MTEKNVVSQSYVREVTGPDRLRDRSKHSQTELAPENGMSRICYHLRSQLKLGVNLMFQDPLEKL